MMLPSLLSQRGFQPDIIVMDVRPRYPWGVSSVISAVAIREMTVQAAM
jgi:hypothetical protein